MASPQAMAYNMRERYTKLMEGMEGIPGTLELYQDLVADDPDFFNNEFDRTDLEGNPVYDVSSAEFNDAMSKLNALQGWLDTNRKSFNKMRLR